MERKSVWMCIVVIVVIALVVYIFSRPSKENYDHTPGEDADAEMVLIPPHLEEENHGIEIIPSIDDDLV